ncbi:hypothetical protein DVH24_001053 [Malus domestica]|uniref:F-box domain-containing protein n=1 Tax=Malus domestica TaxID=3750 RepID=A0A498JY39_MALDO|nr:hypothetical protein DVH24_001053 [Malus domestica]
MNLEAVGDLALHIILSKLGAEDSAKAACVSTKLRASASDESLWSLFCARDLHLSQPLDPLGNLAPSFKKVLDSKPLNTVPHFFFWVSRCRVGRKVTNYGV